jgi:hypothetical protein
VSEWDHIYLSRKGGWKDPRWCAGAYKGKEKDQVTVLERQRSGNVDNKRRMKNASVPIEGWAGNVNEKPIVTRLL